MLTLISLDAVRHFICARNDSVTAKNKKSNYRHYSLGNFFFSRHWQNGDQICLLLYIFQVTVGLL